METVPDCSSVQPSNTLYLGNWSLNFIKSQPIYCSLRYKIRQLRTCQKCLFRCNLKASPLQSLFPCKYNSLQKTRYCHLVNPLSPHSTQPHQTARQPKWHVNCKAPGKFFHHPTHSFNRTNSLWRNTCTDGNLSRCWPQELPA